MFGTALIAFREFFEAFLIVGVFLGISKKLKLHKEREIIFAAATGFGIAFLLSTLTYLFADYARTVLNHESAEALESYLMVFSGCFIAYVVFSLHKVLSRSRGGKLLEAHQKLESQSFDLSLFAMIALLVAREGFEIALFTATVSLFAAFMQNMLGLVIGFVAAGIIGSLSYLSYLKFPLSRVFKTTEYMIVLLGASLVQNGLTELAEQLLHVHLKDILQLPLHFLPDQESIIGHLLQTFTGLDRELSLPRLGIMLVYILAVYLLFLRKPQLVPKQ
ncbi:MAG TPA: FTR1 family protein [Patescibacteria group bacterium]|nr:FTR1 family protein [Patescibacteria group bacterium]